MADVTLNIRHNASQAAPAVGQLADEMGRMAKQSKSASTAGTAAANGFNKIGAACLNVGKSAKTGASGLSKFTSSLGRIAYYRLIRTAIKYVGQAFRDGLQAAYAFSKANQPADYAKLAGAMDGIKKAASTMSLQLGAAFGGLITAIAPILIRIINLVTAAADAITRFFAVLNGSDYYKKASSGFEEVGNSAGGAGKKIKGLLASWDELNVIGKESGGGGGGSSSADYSGAYEWVQPESDWATLFASGNFFGLGAKINDSLGNVSKTVSDWANGLKNLHVGTKVAEFLNGIFADRESFESAGKAVGDVLTTLASAVSDFVRDFKWEDAVAAVQSFMNGFFEAVEGEEGSDRWLYFERSKAQIEGFLELFKPSTWAGVGLDFKVSFYKDVQIPFQEAVLDYNKWIIEHPILAAAMGFNVKAIREEVDSLSESLDHSKQKLEEAELAQAKYRLEQGKSLTVAQEILLGIRDQNGALTAYGREVKGVTTSTDELSDSTQGLAYQWSYAVNTTRDLRESLDYLGAINAIKLKIQAQVEKKIEFKELFENFFKPSSNKAEVEVAPEVKEPVGTSKIFGTNSGVTSGGGKTNLNLCVLPSLGPVKPFYDDMDYKITGKTSKPWQALTEPMLKEGDAFIKDMNNKVTGKTSKPWQALVNPKYNNGKDFVKDMGDKVTGKTSTPWKALVNPMYNNGKQFVKDMGDKVTGKTSSPWKALVDPKYNSGAKFVSSMKEHVTGQTSSPWQALVDPKYNNETSFVNAMKKNVTCQTSTSWKALVDPKYNSDTTFFTKLQEKVTGVTNYTKVNPELSVPQKYKDAMGDLTDAKTVNITPKLTDAKAFKEQLKSALKASASIKTTVSGTTQTIGEVSMSEYAQGGWPNIGDLFIANEAGPELVGTIGGSTAVANNDDIVQGIQGGVERANSEQNELIRKQNSILMQLLNKELTISPSVGLGQVMARSAALYGRA